jgi:hypothetical protein
VVLAVWYKKVFPAEASQFYDAKETLTDANGEFFIPGMGRLILSNIEYADLIVFKSEYSKIGLGPWKSIVNNEKIPRNNIEWENDNATLYLKKLTMEQRRKQLVSRVSAPDEKQQLLRREIDKDNKEVGKRWWHE